MASRRDFLEGACAALAAEWIFFASAGGQTRAMSPGSFDQAVLDGTEKDVLLEVGSLQLSIDGRNGAAIAVNGSIPGPILRLHEGQDAVIQVRNRLAESTSIHWHGVLLPPDMDGVPGVSFAGIPAGSIFTYRFPVRQSGTYWAHSHSGAQELLGLYFPLIVVPSEPEPFKYDRDYVVMLSDWSFLSPVTIMAKLKKQSGYFNYQKRVPADLTEDASRGGFLAAVEDRLRWAKMRMDPTDFADVTGVTYHYLMNGLSPEANWTGQFQPGERIRLRFIAAGAMTYFDVRIPGLRMTVVQSDGQNVRPVEVDEFRIAPGETFDVVVQPDDRAYTVFAEAMDRSGYSRGTLAPRLGMTAPIPPQRKRSVRSMADMGMGAMGGMNMPAESMPSPTKKDDMAGMEGMSPSTADNAPAKSPAASATTPTEIDTGGIAAEHGGSSGPKGAFPPGSAPLEHSRDTHGAGNSTVPKNLSNRLADPGSGFEANERRVLTYADLASVEMQSDERDPARTIELHITGNMDRYMWSFDGKKYSEARNPIPFRRGERLRMILVNDTMMEHPIHLHGMWMELENGAGMNQPLKHTISVKPAERLSVAITPVEAGRWALHCHLLLHMEMGMFRVVEVTGTGTEGL